MSKFWTWGDFVSWEHCIEANKLCNLKNCPETMNCCVTNCIGMPTIKGIVLAVYLVVLVSFWLWVFSVMRNAKKTAKEVKREEKQKNG